MNTSIQQASVLVIDDDEDVLLSAELLLGRFFSHVDTVSNPDDIARAVEEHDYQVFLLDMNFSLGENIGEEGFKWLKWIKERDPAAVVVLITAYGDISRAVQSIKFGAADYILKPWSNNALVGSIKSGLKLHQNKFKYPGESDVNDGPANEQGEVIYGSEQMRQIMSVADRVAPTDANILITGENGTGKGLLAKHIHRNSKRADAPFISVDLSALSESLIESELFGHKKGAFTDARSDRDGYFVTASGGTLFLDEIGNIPVGIQIKLLKVLEEYKITPVGSSQEKTVDVRILSATNMPLSNMVDSRTFRNDLFYRLNTFHLHIPQLRERIDDIEVLVNYFMKRTCVKYEKYPKTISSDVWDGLRSYPWPGNVRELAHAVERAVILAEGDEFNFQDFVQEQVKPSVSVADNVEETGLARLEIDAIKQALHKYEGNISNAADALKITRTSLYRRLKKYNL